MRWVLRMLRLLVSRGWDQLVGVKVAEQWGFLVVRADDRGGLGFAFWFGACQAGDGVEVEGLGQRGN